MQLSLHRLVPIPLKNKIDLKGSAIWKEEITFKENEHVFVRAPSGTGKTTLVHILYNMRTDYEGTVQWGTETLTGIDSDTLSQLRTKKLSIIFQDMRLFPELSTWENLDIKRRLTHTVTLEEVDSWLERLGIRDKKDALARTLSYGEQQRVAIIRALLQPFEWLLMDEPFSHLDHANIDKARKLIIEVVEKHKAGMILADLDENNYFPYTQTLVL